MYAFKKFFNTQMDKKASKSDSGKDYVPTENVHSVMHKKKKRQFSRKR